MKTEKTPQERARDKWNEENKDKRKIYTAKSGCRRYIKEFANLEDLEEVRAWIDDKEMILKNENSEINKSDKA